jgi:hypothetical protein
VNGLLAYVAPNLSTHLRYIVYNDDVVTSKFVFTVNVVVAVIVVEDKERKVGVAPLLYYKKQLESVHEVDGTNNY